VSVESDAPANDEGNRLRLSFTNELGLKCYVFSMMKHLFGIKIATQDRLRSRKRRLLFVSASTKPEKDCALFHALRPGSMPFERLHEPK